MTWNLWKLRISLFYQIGLTLHTNFSVKQTFLNLSISANWRINPLLSHGIVFIDIKNSFEMRTCQEKGFS